MSIIIKGKPSIKNKSMGVPTIFTKQNYNQNGSEWPKTHFKHNFMKCKILHFI